MNRRTLLSTTLLATAAGTGLPLLGATPAGAATGVDAIDLGPAALACNTLSGGFVGDRPYLVSHLALPARLGLFDAAVTEPQALVELPTGGGAWASLGDEDGVFVGTHTVADLYRWDVGAEQPTLLHSLPGATYIWDMSRTPDGAIYLGSYPDGKVWEYSPDTGELRDLGVMVEGEKYVRSIAADATTVYAGVGDNARIIAVDRAGGGKRDITPPEFLGESFVYRMAQTETHLIAGSHGTGLLAIIAKDDPTDYRIVDPEGVVTIGQLAAGGPDEAWFAAGTGLWRLRLDTGAAEQLTTHLDGEFAAALHVRADGTVAMFSNFAKLWTYHPDTAELTESDFQRAGMPAAPDLPQSLCAHDGSRVYVGGHGGMDVHRPDAPEATERIRFSGEAKAMLTDGPHVYFALYTSASLVRLDPRSGELDTLATIGNEQNRPNDLALDRRRKLILIASSPDYGRIGGALSIYDQRSGGLDVHRNPVPDHPIVSVAVHQGRGWAFLGSERTDSTESGTVAVFDLESRRVLRSFVPVPGAAAVPHLAVIDDVLYGTTNGGVLFAHDLRTGEQRQATLATGRVDLLAVGPELGVTSALLPPGFWRTM